MTAVKSAVIVTVMENRNEIPEFPAALAWGLRWAPVSPLRIACDRLVVSLAKRRPRLFQRIGAHAGKTVLIDPTDLPIVFRLTPDPAHPKLEVARNGVTQAYAARIAGPLAALIGLVHGAYDGDALFFSRDLTIEGDTEAVVALRNAIDNEEIDLVAEVGAIFGPFAKLVARPMNGISALLERLTGVALTRHRLAERAL